MRIKSLYINGFGKFGDWKPPTEFSGGLTVVQGPNEAGKTTLLEFIRRMLYGFPDGRRRVNHYPPLRGGNLGGRMELIGADGEEYILHRRGSDKLASLTRPDGSTVTGKISRSPLGPCDQIFYENVCAIGLYELQEIATLKKDEVRDRLAAAGAGNLPLRDVSNALQKNAGDIFIMKGKKKLMNSLISEMRTVEIEIREVMHGLEAYDSINEEISREEDSIREKEGIQRDIEEEIAHMRALEQAWETFNNRRIWHDVLRELPPVEPFQDGAAEVLGRLEGEVWRLRAECQELREECTALETEASCLSADGRILGQADVIRALERRIEQYRGQLDDLERARQDVEGQEQRLISTLKAIGEGWDRDRIAHFDTSSSAKDGIYRLRERLASIEKKRDSQRSLLEMERSRFKEVKERLSDLQRDREDMGAVTNMEAARKRLQDSRRLLEGAKQAKEVEERLFTIQQEDAKLGQMMTMARPIGTVPSWAGPLAILSAIMVLAWGTITDAFLMAAIIALMMIIAAAGIFIARKGAHARRGTHLMASHEGMGDLASMRDNFEQKRELIEQKMRTLAASLGVEVPSSETAAQELMHMLQDEYLEAQKASKLDKEVSRAMEQFLTAEASLREVEDSLDAFISEHDRTWEEWREWCRDHGLGEMTNPDRIPDILAKIEQASDLIIHIREDSVRKDGLEKYIRAFEDEITSVHEACGEPLGTRCDIALEGLIKSLAEEERVMREHEDLMKRLEGKRNDHEKRKRKYYELKEQLDSLLRGRNVDTPEEYRGLIDVSNKRQDLEEKIRAAESHIRRISGKERYDDFLEMLEGHDPISVGPEMQRREEILEGIRKEIKELHEGIGKLRERLSVIEGDKKLTLLLSRQAALGERIQQASLQWAVYTVALGLLGMAVETFERERQPGILREAQSFLAEITGGKYVRIINPLDGSDLYIEGATGTHMEVGHLSRGTAEQLYLALRFGYIRDYVDSSSPVPVVFDDILVNFDPERRRNACRAIAGLAQTCQVIYFTCHPQTAEDLVEAVPGTVVMDLSDG